MTKPKLVNGFWLDRVNADEPEPAPNDPVIPAFAPLARRRCASAPSDDSGIAGVICITELDMPRP